MLYKQSYLWFPCFISSLTCGFHALKAVLPAVSMLYKQSYLRFPCFISSLTCGFHDGTGLLFLIPRASESIEFNLGTMEPFRCIMSGSVRSSSLVGGNAILLRSTVLRGGATPTPPSSDAGVTFSGSKLLDTGEILDSPKSSDLGVRLIGPTISDSGVMLPSCLRSSSLGETVNICPRSFDLRGENFFRGDESGDFFRGNDFFRPAPGDLCGEVFLEDDLLVGSLVIGRSRWTPDS